MIEYKPPHYKVEWKYDKNEDYKRYMGGQRHITGEGESINAQNIIIQFLPANVQDEKLRLNMDVIGEGEAIICSRGECRAGEWKKSSTSQRTQYYLDNGDAAPLKPGTTWIEVVRPIRNITISNYEL